MPPLTDRLTRAAVYYPLGYKPALDGLRAFAVLPVMLFHGGAPGFQWGYIGVDVFFGISGYLITSILLKEYVETGHISLLGFYRRRALRLLPALALVCLAVLLFMGFVLNSWDQAWREMAIVAVYAGNWTRAFGSGLPQYMGHTWSLAIEEQFYIIWPVLLLTMLSLTRSGVALLRMIAVLVLIVVAWRIGMLLSGASAGRLYNGTDTRADSLLIGAWTCRHVGIPSFWKGIRCVFEARVASCRLGLGHFPVLMSWQDRDMALGGFTVVSLAVAVILAGVSVGGWLANVLAHPILVWIGRRPYGLYLWH